jgi:hypothetical protein
MGAMGGRSGGRLLVLCASAVCLWEQAAAAGGAIFTGRIDAFCVSKMMVNMLFFAMVCSAPPSPAPGPVPPARVAPPLGCACCRGYVGHSSCVCWVCVCVCVWLCARVQSWEFLTGRLETKVRSPARVAQIDCRLRRRYPWQRR